jgi:hypothetical protein
MNKDRKGAKVTYKQPEMVVAKIYLAVVTQKKMLRQKV